MAAEDNPETLARKIFLITMAGAVVSMGVAFFWVILG